METPRVVGLSSPDLDGQPGKASHDRLEISRKERSDYRYLKNQEVEQQVELD